mmetsp:Transcript_44181/g.94109  ORF Transcript_44181/g.94109 Transcript_44181/m.94109 type:complete len:223 (-) Transcript_44181:462-1130(-)
MVRQVDQKLWRHCLSVLGLKLPGINDPVDVQGPSVGDDSLQHIRLLHLQGRHRWWQGVSLRGRLRRRLRGGLLFEDWGRHTRRGRRQPGCRRQHWWQRQLLRQGEAQQLGGGRRRRRPRQKQWRLCRTGCLRWWLRGALEPIGRDTKVEREWGRRRTYGRPRRGPKRCFHLGRRALSALEIIRGDPELQRQRGWRRSGTSQPWRRKVCGRIHCCLRLESCAL